MSSNPARVLLEQSAAAASLEDVRNVISESSVPLDANFYEKLLWQIGEWQNASNEFANIGRRAFSRLWEFRFRQTDVDHWVSAETQAFIQEMLHKHDAANIQRFAVANQSRFSPNVVEGLLAADVFTRVDDKNVRLALNEIAGAAADALQMRLTHLPPKFFRDSVHSLFTAYQTRNMMPVLAAIPAQLLEQTSFTIAGLLDTFERNQQLGHDRDMTTFVNFVEALAKHLSDAPPAASGYSHDAAIYIYERLITLYDKNGLVEEFGRAVANREDTELRRDRR